MDVQWRVDPSPHGIKKKKKKKKAKAENDASPAERAVTPSQKAEKRGKKARQEKQHAAPRQESAGPGPSAPEPKANPLSRTSSTTRAHLTGSAFSSLALSAPTRRAVAEVLGYEAMTVVQEQTLGLALKGRDVIARARTGTGKTIAFLLPTVERLAAATGGLGGVGALAISPTRELASQIRAECEQLIAFHKPRLSSLVVVGGTDAKKDASRIRAAPT